MTVMPGETPDPGRSPYGTEDNGGKSDWTPDPKSAGQIVTPITVIAVDNYWNQVSVSTNAVINSPTDAYGWQAYARTLINGTTSFEYVFRTSGQQKVSISPVYGSAVYSSTSSAVQISPASADRLLVLLPGESHAPGRDPYDAGGAPANPCGGKNNCLSPAGTAWTAGISTSVMVMVTDAFWNKVGDSRNVILTPSDPKTTAVTQPLETGTTVFNFAMYTAVVSTGTYRYLDASVTGLNYSAYRTQDISLLPDTPYKLRILTGNLRREPGTLSGKAGALYDKTAGAAFDVTVDITDKWGNMVSSEPVITVTTPDDGYDSIGNSFGQGLKIQLNDSGSGGTTSFAVTMITERTDDPLEATSPSTSLMRAEVPGLESDSLALEVDDDSGCVSGLCQLLLSVDSRQKCGRSTATTT